jgi:hypothetical protein
MPATRFGGGVGDFKVFAKGAGFEFDLRDALRRLMYQFVEPLGVSSNKNPPSIGFSRVEN